MRPVFRTLLFPSSLMLVSGFLAWTVTSEPANATSHTTTKYCRFSCTPQAGVTPRRVACTDDLYVRQCGPECDRLCGSTACGERTSFTCEADAPAPAPSAAGTGPGAAARARGSSTRLQNPLGNITLPQLAGRIIRTGIGLVGSLALLMFIYGGIRYITAGGSEENVKTARSILKYATIGLLLIFFSYTIVAAFFAAFTPR
jgi:hypothetical protein